MAQQPERFFVAEILREKIFLQYSQEVPYCTAVRVSNHLPQSLQPPCCRALRGSDASTQE